MIERYTITSTPQALHERFAVDVPDFYKPNFNASPTQLLPIITSDSPQGISLFYWGETPGWAKNKTPGEKIINIRVESMAEKTALKKAIMKTRCLIPADGFYAWKKVGKKITIPYRFVLADNALFSMPGLWEEFEDDDGSEMHTFTVFTTAANETVKNIQERMPVIFDKAAEAIWLKKDGAENKIMSLLESNQNLKLNYYPVSPRINDVKADLPSLIIPTLPADQHGNLTLFD
jgi:putative SOS response-associated peptidase YedK